MLSPDLQRIKHIRDYCNVIADAIERFGNTREDFESNVHFQQSVSFSIIQIAELSEGDLC